MDVSIIIVNYNTRDLLKDCLISIYKHTTEIDFEVIVSDNGSVDGSIEMLKKEFPQVVLIENNANLGFGTANNRGLAVAKGQYIFYLNSDTILLNNAVKMFYDYWETSPEKESIGALGCNLLDQNLIVSDSFGNFPDVNDTIVELVKANYGMLKYLLKKLILRKSFGITRIQKQKDFKLGEVDIVIGADLFLKNDKYARFDENIFLYHEEMDLQYQMMLVDKKRLLIDGPKIIHLEGCSAPDTKEIPFEEITRFSSRCKNISRIYYFKKNISSFKAFWIKLFTITLWLNPLVFKYTKQSFRDLIWR